MGHGAHRPPTDLKALRDAVLDTAGPIGIAGAGTAADWAGRLARSTPCWTPPG